MPPRQKGDGKVSINEVFGFDEGLLMMLPNQVAALTCMRRMPDKKAADKERGDPSTKAAFYMKQSGTLDNACGIIALIHSILNTLDADGVGLTEGSPLAQFQSDNAGKTPEERCASLEGFTAVRVVIVNTVSVIVNNVSVIVNTRPLKGSWRCVFPKGGGGGRGGGCVGLCGVRWGQRGEGRGSGGVVRVSA